MLLDAFSYKSPLSCFWQVEHKFVSTIYRNARAFPVLI